MKDQAISEIEYIFTIHIVSNAMQTGHEHFREQSFLINVRFSARLLLVFQLGFGKGQPTNVLWIDELPSNITELILRSYLCRLTNFSSNDVLDIYIDNRASQKNSVAQCLVYFKDIIAAQTAINLVRGKRLNGKRLQVDFASRVFLTKFSDIIEETNQKKKYVEERFTYSILYLCESLATIAGQINPIGKMKLSELLANRSKLIFLVVIRKYQMRLHPLFAIQFVVIHHRHHRHQIIVPSIGKK